MNELSKVAACLIFRASAREGEPLGWPGSQIGRLFRAFARSACRLFRFSAHHRVEWKRVPGWRLDP